MKRNWVSTIKNKRNLSRQSLLNRVRTVCGPWSATFPKMIKYFVEKKNTLNNERYHDLLICILSYDEVSAFLLFFFALLTWDADQGPSKVVAFFRIPSKIFSSGTWNFRIIEKNIKAIFKEYFSSLREDSGKIFKLMTFRRWPRTTYCILLSSSKSMMTSHDFFHEIYQFFHALRSSGRLQKFPKWSLF